MGDTFIFIMGLICTGTVVAATFLSINELKDVNEPQLEIDEHGRRDKKTFKTYFNSYIYYNRFCLSWFILFLFYICLMKLINTYWWWNHNT